MFDIKPVNEAGHIQFGKINSLEDTIILRELFKKNKNLDPVLASYNLPEQDVELPIVRKKEPDPELEPEPRSEMELEPEVEPSEEVAHLEKQKKDEPLQIGQILTEFESTISAPTNTFAELARFGAQVHEIDPTIRQRVNGPIKTPEKNPSLEISPPDNLPLANQDKEENGRRVLANNPERMPVALSGRKVNPNNKEEARDEAISSFMSRKTEGTPVSRELEFFLGNLRENREATLASKKIKKSPIKNAKKEKSKKSFGWAKRGILGVALVSVLGFVAINQGLTLKDDIITNGDKAVFNLEEAKKYLEKMDFLSAANNFALASENFSQSSQKLNFIGASFASLLSDVPGFEKIKAAKNLSIAGKNISDAGESLADAFDSLSRTNVVSFIGLDGKSKQSILEHLEEVKSSLVFAQEKISGSYDLLSDIDASILPEDKRESFDKFKEKIPELRDFVTNTIEYSDLLAHIVGKSGASKYLILFQNNSELRPTGGFPGSYGILDFKNGYLEKIFIDDIYNPDGQISENIIPPKQLQHITPTWGMRDANWFANFPDSAKKVMEMYQKDGGPKVDGILTITPTVIARILEIVGPIEMPEYGTTLTSENFIASIQEEVEYGDNKKINQPKKIVVDFVPKFLERLAMQDKESWAPIFEIIMNSVKEKHILTYFENSKYQKIAEKNNIAGNLIKTEGDYLMVAHSNVKGSKADAVTENALELNSKINSDGFIEHILSITRSHKGGKSNFGFYNRQNPDYVRVYVPDGSVLLDIKGNSKISPDSIINYNTVDNFVADDDLFNYESKVRTTGGVDTFKEVDKDVFGFWMVIDPSKTETVTLRYLTPIKPSKNYDIYIQKQPGTIEDKFNFSLDAKEGDKLESLYPQELSLINNKMVLDTNLLTDKTISIRWQ